MKKLWENHSESVQALIDELQALIGILPHGKEYWKRTQALKKRVDSVVYSGSKLENVITDDTPPIPISSPWSKKEFKEHWKMYKDYLLEQHGVRMGSRMELFRMKFLKEQTGDDPDVAIRWLRYYMAQGALNVYKVVEQVNTKENEQTTKAGFSLSNLRPNDSIREIAASSN